MQNQNMTRLMDIMKQKGGEYWAFENDIEREHGDAVQAMIDRGLARMESDGGLGMREGLVLTKRGRQAVGLPPKISFLHALFAFLTRKQSNQPNPR